MKQSWKRLLSLAVALTLVLGLLAPAYAADAPTQNSAQGQQAGDSITRGELAKLLSDRLNLKTEAKNNFTDLPADAWYTPYVLRCAAFGILSGRGNGTVGPTDPVTRQEACKMIAVALDLEPAKGQRTSFSDDAAIDDWAAPYVAAMSSAGYIEGVGGNRFAPAAALTEDAANIILDRALKDGDSDNVKETGHTNDYDAKTPYFGVNVGLFHNVPITVDKKTSGVATYYLPEGMSPWAPAVIVLTPGGTTAKEFSGTETGLAWRAVADTNKIAVAFLGPQYGKTWNLSLSGDGRDDAAVLNQLYLTMRQKGTNLKGAFSMDKSHTALVGYEEGGAAALLFGARWASDFSAICAVDAASVPAASLTAVGKEYVMPFPGDTTRGIEEEAIAAKTVDTPVWFINSSVDGANKAVLDYYVTAAKASAGKANSHAAQVYNTGREGSDVEIWVSTQAQTPETIWAQFLGTYKRFMAMQLPGRVSKAQDFTQKGFTIHEETVNGELRRWMTYVPSTYTGQTEVPLVLVMHGYTASMYAIAEESRWYDVAEENGFIVVFAQGQVRPAGLMGNVPTAMWLGGAFGKMLSGDTDPDTDLKFLDSLLDKLEDEYKIDSSRIYATGHSNGSMMTWNLGTEYTDRFAAIAPVGSMVDSVDGIDKNVLLPTWSFLGEYDSAGDPTLVEGGSTVKTLQAWNQHNGTDEERMSTSEDYDGAFVTRTFPNDSGVPLVRFTEVKDTPHVYLQEESEVIWNDFFSKYSRGEDGALYYQADDGKQPVKVEASAHNASSGWYAPSEKAAYTYDAENPYDAAITGRRDGVMIKAGDEIAAATVYIPEGAQPYCPVVLVLTPDGTTAAAFADSETGKAWMAAADAQEAGVAFDKKFVVAFMGPEAGNAWNLDLAKDGRDDAALVNALYTTIRSRSLSQRHPAGVNRGWISLVGYEEGGAAALLFGARHAANFSSICAVDATNVPADSLKAVGQELVAPFTGDGSTNGAKELRLKAQDVPMPVWLINSSKDNSHVVDFFKAANGSADTVSDKNALFDTLYANKDNEAKLVAVTDGKDVAPQDIWKNFTGQVKRLRALQKGGRLAFAQDYTQKGFTVTQEIVNGEPRRWITYVPASYTGEAEVPLVFVLHGYGATMTGIAEESRWYDVAEKNGFIVIFANALNVDGASRGNLPAPTWRSDASLNPDNADVKFLNELLDRAEEQYKIDAGRVYITGHSNGSMMTWTMAINSLERFAAVGPCGYMVPYTGETSTDAPIAVWGFLGEYDSVGSAKLVEGNNTVKALQAWNQYNGIDETRAKAEKETVEYADSFATETFFTPDGVPLVKFTEVMDTPHVYLQEEASHLWDFFTHYRRGEDGKLFYQADKDSPEVEVKSDGYKADSGWYTAK